MKLDQTSVLKSELGYQEFLRLQDHLILWDIERVGLMQQQGKCICHERERERFTCPVHKITFPAKGVHDAAHR